MDELTALRTFTRRVITICTDGDPDGDFVLEMALSEGLLRLVPDRCGCTIDGEPAMRYEPTDYLGETLTPSD